MEDGMSIDVEYRGSVFSFNVKLATTGYAHNFHVLINNIEVVYEPDEERNYRAVVNADIAPTLKGNDRDLIQLVCEKLDALKHL